MEILVCVKRVPMVGGKIVVTARRPGRGHPDVRLHRQPARGVRGRGGGPAGRALRRRRHGAHPRAGRGRGPAARHAGARRAAEPCCWRPTAGSGGRWRRRRRSSTRSAGRAAAATTCCCSATRRPTPAATRCRCGSRTRSACPAYRHQEPRGHRHRRRRRCPGQPGVPGRPRRPSTSRCPRWSASRRASTCPGIRRCPAGCGPSERRSSGHDAAMAAEGLRKARPAGARRPNARRPRSSAPGPTPCRPWSPCSTSWGCCMTVLCLVERRPTARPPTSRCAR